MPLYEYQCDDCQRRFEVIQKYSDPRAEICPTCNGPVKRLISAPAIQFKGSGFYLTDYGRSGQGKNEGGEGTSAKKEGGGDAKAESTKAETSSEKKSSEGKGTDTKSSDSKPSDTKTSENKTTKSKSTDTKSTDSKSSTSSETKPS